MCIGSSQMIVLYNEISQLNVNGDPMPMVIRGTSTGYIGGQRLGYQDPDLNYQSSGSFSGNIDPYTNRDIIEYNWYKIRQGSIIILRYISIG